MSKKKLLIIYTGGTIGMEASDKGYVPSNGLLTKAMAETLTFSHPEMPGYDIKEYNPLVDSSDMSHANWTLIAEDIFNHYEQYDGFIVLHGTDTMAYSACAVSFMLRHLAKPVIFTGSQVPLVQAHTDARENLINAMLFAVRFSIPEVCVFFNNKLYRGNRCHKLNATSFDAFSSPNYPWLGEVGINLWFNEASSLSAPTAELEFKPINSAKLITATLFPGFQAELLKDFIDAGLQAIVLRTYGIGNAPANQDLLLALEYAQKNNVIILNCSQCQTASVDMNTYASGKQLLQYGVLSGYDMTLEAAITKLYYAFSCYDALDDIKSLMTKDISGEMTV